MTHELCTYEKIGLRNSVDESENSDNFIMRTTQKRLNGFSPMEYRAKAVLLFLLFSLSA